MLEFTEAIFGFILSKEQESFTDYCCQNKTMTKLFLDMCKSSANKTTLQRVAVDGATMAEVYCSCFASR